MGYSPEPAPELSELEERHRLQQHAHSIGYVTVPEALWERIRAALRFGPGNVALSRDIQNLQEAIERERS